jgi:hypothetical protein
MRRGRPHLRMAARRDERASWTSSAGGTRTAGERLAANTINVGADLAGMADAAEMLSGIDSHWFVVVFGVGIACATIWLPYARLAGVLTWRALSLFAT